MEKGNAIAELVNFSGGYVKGEPALTDVSLSFRKGELTALIGPNGAGKSSLLRALTSSLPFTSGAAFIDGCNVATLSPLAIARNVALMTSSRQSGFTSGLSVSAYVTLGRTPHRSLFSLSDSQSDRTLVSETLSLLGISHLSTRLLASLSDGQRQLASLARALVQEPSLLLLDEPTSNLDPSNAQMVLQSVSSVTRSRGIATVTVLHDVNIAALFADRVAILRGGRLIASGPTTQVLTASSLSLAYGIPFSTREAFFPA